MVSPFKKCPCCSRVWSSRSDFLQDGSLEVNGYSPDFESLQEGLFYFTHQVDGCLSTMVIKAKNFVDLYTGRKYSERKTGAADCLGYCLNKEELRSCQVQCECAYVREILKVIQEYPKNHAAIA